MGRLDGAVVIVTGAARGQGEAEAVLAAREGAQVIVTDVLDELGEDVARAIGATYQRLDVSSASDWTALVASVVETHGRIDGLVNNAGIFRYDGVLEGDVDTFRLVQEVNQIGVYNGMIHVAPVMCEQKSGSIVNISSVAGLRGMGSMAYTASKWAVRGMTKAAARELGQHNVRVNSIHPGLIDTDMLAQLGDGVGDALLPTIPLGRLAASSEVAEAAIWLLSDAASYVSGSEVAVDGAMSV